MSIVVTRSPSVAIRPSEPSATSSKLVLSSFDKFFVGAPSTVLLVFEHPIHDPVETIKRALSHALHHSTPSPVALHGVLSLARVGSGWGREERSPSVAIRPPEPSATSRKLVLSSFDKFFVGAPSTVLLVFEHPIHDLVETIKRALSHALQHYHPFAGRLAGGEGDGDEEEVHIACTGEGATFVAASANCALRDVDFSEQQELLFELAVYYPGCKGCSRGDPLLMMQVTVFTCGGFVLGASWHHVVADGAGMAQFLQAVGELARGLPAPTVVPIRHDESLPAVPPTTLALKGLPTGDYHTDQPPEGHALLHVTIPWGFINRVRDELNFHPRCTAFEAVAAAIWRCRTRAVMTDPDAPALLLFTVNLRGYLGAKDGYYGNCIGMHMVVAPSCGMVANADVAELVGMIRRAKEQMSGTFGGDDADQLRAISELRHVGYDNLLYVSCWRNLGFEEVDFGGGKTTRVMAYTEMALGPPTGFLCMPCKGEEGANVTMSATGCVKPEHADAFVREIATLK
uniref:Uncharacterized protein n=1 Tax=Leersia perrieri TaxID=77586 RepID=A0A0D9XHP6_9ORYZ